MSYEYLIRKAYNCNRGGADGRAEADVYRRMEKVENAIKMRMFTVSNGELEYNYRSAAVQVSMNIYEALMKVVNEFYFTDSSCQ